MSAVKSILSFAKRIGYLQFDVGSAFELKKPRDVLVERRLEQREVLAMIDKTNCPRDQAYLRVLYSSGFRVSELCGLRWKDIIFRDDIALATAYGKGGKTRTVKISLASYHAITALRGNKADDALVIGLSTAQVTRMVKTAAKRAGIALPVSAHWMRHSHIFHAIENGCPLNEAQAQAGHSSLATTGRYLHANPRRGSSDYLAV
jgi:integrase/recombinase XerD